MEKGRKKERCNLKKVYKMTKLVLPSARTTVVRCTRLAMAFSPAGPW